MGIYCVSAQTTVNVTIHDNDMYVGQVLQFLMVGLRIPQVSTYAAHALREMCDKCKIEMTPHFNGLLEVIFMSIYEHVNLM